MHKQVTYNKRGVTDAGKGKKEKARTEERSTSRPKTCLDLPQNVSSNKQFFLLKISTQFLLNVSV